MHIAGITVYQLHLPLHHPYRVSFRTYTALEPLFVEILTADGIAGWGEAYIPPGSTVETPDTGWTFCTEQARRLVGKTTADAHHALQPLVGEAPFASTAFDTALAMVERHPALKVDTPVRIPLLVPLAAKDDMAIADEVEQVLESGYRTLKIKVGWDVDQDLARVRCAQRALSGRGAITIDANRGYSREQGCRFASALDPEGISLFEQPCGADEWEANAAVAAVSTVPLMLDESIRGLDDVERAAGVKGVGLVKVKVKRLGGIDRTRTVMQRARTLSLDVCLGDGVATELLCWVEACIGRGYLQRAGDMNGFLKPNVRLFREPLMFDRGDLVLERGFWPEIDRSVLARHTVRSETCGNVAMAVGGAASGGVVVAADSAC